MFSKDFLNVLSSLNSFTDKGVLKYPITTLNSPAQDVYININVDKLGCQEFQELGIYELSKTLKMFGLFENPEVKRVDNTIQLQTTTDSSVITLCDLELLNEHNQTSQVIETLEKFPTIAEFELNTEALKTLKSAAGILSELNALKITGKDSNTTLELCFHNRFNSTSNSYKKEFLGTSSKDFELKIGIENFSKLPVIDYKVKVKYNEAKDAYRVIFETEFFTILISKLTD